MTEKKLQATEISVKDLFCNGKVLYNVPSYQRSYSWSEDDATSLFKDIKNFIDTRKLNESYFIGNIILQEDNAETDLKKRVYNIVDGQQRITTLILILSALRIEINYLIKELKNNENINFDLKILKKDIDSMLYFTEEGKEIILKIKNKEFNKNLYDVIEGKESFQITDSNKIYSRNFEAIKKTIRQNQNVNYKFIKDIIESLSDVLLVEIRLSTEDKALTIFENINSKGKTLTCHDLIKNFSYILSSYCNSVFERERIEEKIKDLFDNKIQKELSKPSDIKIFWRIMTSIISGETQPKNNDADVYDSFKKEISTFFVLDHRIIDQDQYYKNIEKFLNLVLLNFDIYQELLKYNADIYRFQNRWERSLSAMVKYTFNSLSLLLFKIYNDYWSEKISKKQFEEIIITLNIYKMRRSLAFSGIKDLKNFSMKYFRYLHFNDEALYKSSFIYWIKEVINDSMNNKDIDNADFILSLMSKNNVYDNKIAYELLIELEWSQSKNESLMVDSERKISVEHILPQTLQKNLKITEGWKKYFNDDEHAKFKDNIGNLTLTFDNQEMGNSIYDKKIVELRKSKLKINEYFQDKDEWTPESIKIRSELLAREVLKSWELK